MPPAAKEGPTTIVLPCGGCGKPAASIELIPANPHPVVHITCLVGEVNFTTLGDKPVSASLFEHLRTLAKTNLSALHALEPDFFGFICGECGLAYCGDCWRNVYDNFDEDGYHDDIRGTCPKNHSQMLQD